MIFSWHCGHGYLGMGKRQPRGLWLQTFVSSIDYAARTPAEERYDQHNHGEHS